MPQQGYVMSLSPDRNGKFTASEIYRLMAENGEIDWSPRREGAKGVGYTCWTGGEYVEAEDRFEGGIQYVKTVFKTDKEYKDFISAERKRLGQFVLSAGAKTYARQKARELNFADDPLSPRIETKDMKRGHEREQEAADYFAMLNEIDLFYTGESQQFIPWGTDSGGTPDARIGSINGVTCDFKCPDPDNHQDNLIDVFDNDSLKKVYPVYYWQQQCQIAAAKQDYGYWVSYNPVAHNPRARLHVVRIDRNQADIDKMEKRVAMAAEYRDQIIQRIRGL